MTAASIEVLVQDAFAALDGHECLDPAAVQRTLADVARALAKALPVRDRLHDPEVHGPPMSHADIKAVAVEVRSFLELVADLLGSSGDPEWMGDDFAFSGALKRRPDWKPPAEPTAAQSKRLAAAVRVYELMAERCLDSGQEPKQEAAIASVMEEFQLARSKVMQGLREYRESWSWLQSWACHDDGDLRLLPLGEQKLRTRRTLAHRAMAKEWMRRNPDARFLWVPAGSALENELLSQRGPREARE